MKRTQLLKYTYCEEAYSEIPASPEDTQSTGKPEKAKFSAVISARNQNVNASWLTGLQGKTQQHPLEASYDLNVLLMFGIVTKNDAVLKSALLLESGASQWSIISYPNNSLQRDSEQHQPPTHLLITLVVQQLISFAGQVKMNFLQPAFHYQKRVSTDQLSKALLFTEMGAERGKVLVAKEVQGLERQGRKPEHINKEKQVIQNRISQRRGLTLPGNCELR